MAALNQNFLRHEHDGDFSLIFTVTNGGTTLGSSNYCAWWGVGNNEDPNSVTSILLQGHTTTGVNSYNIAVSTEGCSSTPSGGALSATTSDVTVAVTNTQVKCTIGYDDFASLNDGSYYHELVLMERTTESGGTCYQCRSQVVATGVLTIEQSLFTNRPFR